jgi:hypothetical protein
LADLLQFDLRSKETEVFGPFCFHQARISLWWSPLCGPHRR